MAIFSACGGDDGEGTSNNHQSRKRQRLPSIEEEDTENSDGGSSGEEGWGIESDEEEDAENSDSESSGGEVRGMASDDGVSGKSGNREDSSSRKDSRPYITDPEILECPICCEPLTIPIFQCDNGHLACSSCCTKVRNKCPSCTLPIGYIRCRGMEKVIEACRVSCPNAKYGCKENTSYGNRFNHEKLCDFTPCSCPILNCNYIGYYKDVNNHVRAEHKNGLIPFVWNQSLVITLDLNEKIQILQEVNDGHVIVIQSFTALHVVCVSVSCIAPVQSKFSCSLEHLVADGSQKNKFMVRNIQQVKRNEQPDEGFMPIASYTLSGNSCAKLLIKIGPGVNIIYS